MGRWTLARHGARVPAILGERVLGLGILVTASCAASCVTACGAPAEEPSPEPPPARAAETLPPAAAEEAPPSSWPTDVEDLAASVESFTSVEACLASLRARTPTAVAEGLADLEYGAFFDDVCRATAAVRDRSREGCDAIEVSSIRRGCRRRLAIVAGDPAACPDDLVIQGRDPLCVAWAARDPGLCRAASVDERAACEAVLAAEPRRCARALDRARCEAWVRRYASALGDERATSAGTREDPRFHLEIVRVIPSATGAASESEPIVLELDTLARGLFLEPDGCALRVVLDQRGERAAIVGRSGSRIELLVASPGAPIEPPIEVALGPGSGIELAHPRLGRARGGTGTVSLSALGTERGSTLAGTLALTIPSPPGEWRVTGSFRTFVRDRGDLPERCAGDRMPAP